jgi:ArsR family transcriptional regulator, arsenate/arsenite/antimonite-responsive transcriptional repressor
MECINISLEQSKMLEAISAVTEVTRCQIILFLGKKGRVCVNDITSNFKISRPAISHHLKVLKNCGIVESEKVGQEIYYFVVRKNIVDTLRKLADYIENCC